MKSPCFNEETQTDCPDRCGGCAAKCEKWAAYVEVRNKEYEERKRIGDANDTINRIYYYNQSRYLRTKARKANRRPRMK